VLIVYVFDAMRLFEQFINRFTETETNWPNLTRTIAHSHFRSKDAVGDWLDIRLLAVRTKEIQKLIYYPFIVLTIMILSRLTAFDNWDFPMALLVVWGICGGYAVVPAVLLTSAAEEARRTAIARLADKSRQARKESRTEDAEELDRTIEEVKGEHEGAFAPWTQHPMLRAILYPSGGLGLITSLQYLFL
jgi:AcrR family transcriptional regulator